MADGWLHQIIDCGDLTGCDIKPARQREEQVQDVILKLQLQVRQRQLCGHQVPGVAVEEQNLSVTRHDSRLDNAFQNLYIRILRE